MTDIPGSEVRATDFEQVKSSLIDAAAIEETRRALAERESRFWRFVAVVLLIMAVTSNLGLFAYIQSGRHTTKNTNAIVRNVSHLVTKIDDATSPAAQAETTQRIQALVTELVDKLDCSNRDALQDVILKLEDQGVLHPDSLVLTCPPPTTLPTTPPTTGGTKP